MERQQQTSDTAEDLDINDAGDRYQRSVDAMRAMRLNPVKVIPADQFPEQTTVRPGGIVRHPVTQRQYAKHLLRVALKNEAKVAEAQTWWAWWEARQKDPGKSGLAPLINPSLEHALRVAATERLKLAPANSTKIPNSSPKESNERARGGKKAAKAKGSTDLDEKACAVVEMFEDPTSPNHNEGWTKADVASILEVSPSALSGKQRDGRPRLRKFEAIWMQRTGERQAAKERRLDRRC